MHASARNRAAPASPARPDARRVPTGREGRRTREDRAATAARLGVDGAPAWLDYVPRGRGECVYANLRVAGRVVGALYDEALEPTGLKASQLALLWAIVAMEPVEFAMLGRETATDPTTLSRTVRTLVRLKLVRVGASATDRRVRLVASTTAGRARFAAAMPYWERAQARVAAVLDPAGALALGREIRRARRASAA